MQRFRFFHTLFIACLAAGCARAPAPSPPARPSAPPPPTITPFTPVPTPSHNPPLPTATAPALTPSASTAPSQSPSTRPPPPGAHLRIECFPLLPGRPPGFAAAGTLALSGAASEAIYIDLASGTHTRVTQPHETRSSFAMSPDRRWVAYRRVVRDALRIQALDDNLVIADASDAAVRELPWDPGWGALTAWLDAERLVLSLAPQHPDEVAGRSPARLAVLDLASGRQTTLTPDMPDITTTRPVPNWDGWGATVYDPSLARVVYLTAPSAQTDSGYALWDVTGRQMLAHTPASRSRQAPRWSPDGSRFVVAANQAEAESWLTYELYSAGRDGGPVQRLTYLTEHYAGVFIQAYTWSPDGRRIAFWLVEDPAGVPFIEHGEAHLAILDTETGIVTNTCLPGEHDASAAPPRVPPPLWSPDGTQVVVENTTAGGASRLILVDLAGGVAVVLGENLQPAAWLENPAGS